MFKSKTSDKIDFSNTTLVLFFPGKGNSTSFALSLLKSNYDFKNIGYLYSEYLASSVSNSSDGKSLEFNGTFYFNSSKKLTILDLTGGVKSRELNEFADELIKFIKDSKFSKIYIVGSSPEIIFF
jgi:predicted ATP-grasp superfamily ATP-dependent carboligase